MLLPTFETNYKQLSLLCELFQKNIIDKGRFQTPMEYQIGNQISMVCADLRENFTYIKSQYEDDKITTTGYASYLKKYRHIIENYVGLDQEKLGSAFIIEEIKNLQQ